MWWVASLGGALVVITGALPLHDATSVTARIAPVLLFLVAVTVVAELADDAGVFDAAAHRAARAAGGSVRRLFLLVVVLATVTTVLLSLDTTAVSLTPVVLATAIQLDLPVLPFAMVTVWLANTASLLLPVSNLTNLLALRRLDLTSLGFAARMWLPAAVAVAVTVVLLGITYRASLRGRFTVGAAVAVADRTLLAVCVAVVAVMAVGFLLVNVTVAACAGAIVLVAVFAVRRRSGLRWSLVPWRLVLLVLGLFLVVGALAAHGLTRALDSVVGSGTALPDLLRLSGVSAVLGNAANNLPTYVALEPTAHGVDPRLLAVLVGVNTGPLVLLWGSLATLLWRERCRARGVEVPARHFAALGIVGVPVLVVACTAALHLTAT